MAFEPIDVDAFVQEFLELVIPRGEAFHSEHPRREFTAWTIAVKDVLAKMGDKRDVESLYTKRQEGLHEFLLDFVWWDRKEGEGAKLACECEFGSTWDEAGNPNRVAENFDKLLSFKAPLKLMLFDSYGPEAKVKTTVDDVLVKLNTYLANYRYHRVASGTCSLICAKSLLPGNVRSTRTVATPL